MMKRHKKKEMGFSLIELLIVMVIMGLLAALVGPRMFGKVGKSKQKAARSQMALFETALDTYRLDVGKYPSTEQGLQALRTKPSDSKNGTVPIYPRRFPKTHGAIHMCTGWLITAKLRSFPLGPTAPKGEKEKTKIFPTGKGKRRQVEG
jgi:prepilin-type N-terminal cleavage/methylation domain-containing protein